jgi:hypothetical protein
MKRKLKIRKRIMAEAEMLGIMTTKKMRMTWDGLQVS